MSYLFDGVDDRIALANVPATAPTQVTFVAWVEVNSFAVLNTVLSYYNIGTNRQLTLLVDPAGSPQVRAPWSSVNGQWRGASGAIAAGAWYGIAGSYDGSSATNDPLLYVKPEGGAIASVAVTEQSAPSGIYTPAIDGLWVGGVSGSFPFSGRLAYVRSFHSILSQAQIDAELSALAAVAAEEIDLALTANANDASGNGHNGTVTGAVLDADNPTLGGGGGGGGNGHVFQRRMRRFISGI